MGSLQRGQRTMRLLSWLFQLLSLGREAQRLLLQHLRRRTRQLPVGTCSPCTAATVCLWQKRKRLCSTALGHSGTCLTLLLRIEESLWARRWAADRRFSSLALAVLS